MEEQTPAEREYEWLSLLSDSLDVPIMTCIDFLVGRRLPAAVWLRLTPEQKGGLGRMEKEAGPLRHPNQCRLFAVSDQLIRFLYANTGIGSDQGVVRGVRRLFAWCAGTFGVDPHDALERVVLVLAEEPDSPALTRTRAFIERNAWPLSRAARVLPAPQPSYD